MYKYLIILLFFVGCVPPTNSTNANQIFVSGVVKHVDLIREDNSNAYVLIHFEDKIVKLRSYYDEPLELPLGQEVNVFYNSNLSISKIVVVNDSRFK